MHPLPNVSRFTVKPHSSDVTGHSGLRARALRSPVVSRLSSDLHTPPRRHTHTHTHTHKHTHLTVTRLHFTVSLSSRRFALQDSTPVGLLVPVPVAVRSIFELARGTSQTPHLLNMDRPTHQVRAAPAASIHASIHSVASTRCHARGEDPLDQIALPGSAAARSLSSTRPRETMSPVDSGRPL